MGKIRLVLPDVIYAVPGIECNIYFDNTVLLLNLNTVAFDVTCPVGMQYQERWSFIPKAQEIGEYPLELKVVDSSNTVLAQGETLVRVVPDRLQDEAEASYLLIGDSFAEYSVYPQHILDLSMRNGRDGLHMIGSRGAGNMPPTGALRHEGYSGWTTEAFTTRSGLLSRSGYHHRPGAGSPFVYTRPDGSSRLDFARYCEEFNQGRGPDLVTIQLGGNDVFSDRDDTIDDTLDQMFSHMETLINAIHAARSDTCIGIVIDTLPSTSQDGFRNYRGDRKQTRWQLRRNQHRMIERMLENYQGREAGHIYIVPNYLNLDCASHFPTWNPARNSRSDDRIKRVNNGTHPTTAGYQQMGDSIYAWINGQIKGVGQ
ncbi:MAG: SGNH/GDSL hydrolase family protein [Phycisphaerales bacterium]